MVLFTILEILSRKGMVSYTLHQNNHRTCFFSARYRVIRASGSGAVVKIRGNPRPGSLDLIQYQTYFIRTNLRFIQTLCNMKPSVILLLFTPNGEETAGAVLKGVVTFLIFLFFVLLFLQR